MYKNSDSRYSFYNVISLTQGKELKKKNNVMLNLNNALYEKQGISSRSM